MRKTYLPLSDEDRDYLKALSKKRTIQAQVVDRARILLYKADGMTFQQIADKLAISTATVRLCISKFQKGGLDAALFDVQRPGRPSEITDDAKAWMIHIACQRPTELGYAQELWTLTSLHKYIQKHAEEAGYPRLSTVTKPYIQKFLKEQDMKPFKIKYYCEKRDPDFGSKMHEVLLVYKQIEMQFDENGDLIVPDDYKLTITVSYDEKPGIQAISNTAPDLRPTQTGKYRDRIARHQNMGKYIVMQNTNVWERSLLFHRLVLLVMQCISHSIRVYGFPIQNPARFQILSAIRQGSGIYDSVLFLCHLY